MPRPRVVLSFDVEDPYRLGDSIGPVVDLLARLDLKATLFVTGEVLVREEPAVLRAAEKGHEIASHGVEHPCCDQADWSKRADGSISGPMVDDYAARSKDMFRGTGLNVVGFRSIGFRSSNRLLVKAAEHFQYFSGLIEPAGPDEFGLIQAPVYRLPPGIRFHPIMCLFLPAPILAGRLARSLDPVVLYFHSYDLQTKPPGLKLYHAAWKGPVYYHQTGRRMERAIFNLISLLKRSGCRFQLGRDLASDLAGQG